VPPPGEDGRHGGVGTQGGAEIRAAVSGQPERDLYSVTRFTYSSLTFPPDLSTPRMPAWGPAQAPGSGLTPTVVFSFSLIRMGIQPRRRRTYRSTWLVGAALSTHGGIIGVVFTTSRWVHDRIRAVRRLSATGIKSATGGEECPHS